MKKWVSYTTLAILTGFILLVYIVFPREILIVESSRPFENFPTQVLGMTGTDEKFPQYVLDALNADGNLYRHYVQSSNEEGGTKFISLYVGYYGTEKGGRPAHVPEVCYPSSGWTILDASTQGLDLPGGVKKKVNRFILTMDGRYRVVYIWYQNFRGQIVTSGIGLNLNRFVNRIYYTRDDGAFVRIEMASVPEKIFEHERKLKEFASVTFGLLRDNWPKERKASSGGSWISWKSLLISGKI